MRKIIFVAFLWIIACKSTPKQPDEKSPLPVSEQMDRMAKDVRQLIPFVYNREAYHASGNQHVISATLKDFSEHAHKITTKMTDDDPLVQFSLQNLDEDLKRAHQAFDMGQLEYSRTVVKSSMNHCFRCHSLTEAGSDTKWDVQGLDKLVLGPLDKAELLVAIRKDDQALQHMEKWISNQVFLEERPFDYELMLRRYLALIIRAENQPGRALNELNKIVKTNALPRYIAEQLQGWRSSLEQWVNEAKKPQKKVSPIGKARERIERATHMQQYPQDHAGDVEYLRATAILHEALKQKWKPEEEAECLFLLGRAYEVLDELGSWNLHESYFEACVNKAPHSSWAKLCFARLEASVLQGYSGSSGTHVPAYEKDKLRNLKEKL